jgi:membrane-bound lytic murein transglycosylase A
LRRFGILAALAVLAAALFGFYFWQSTRPGPLRLAQKQFSQLPGWAKADLHAALDSFHRGCAALAAKPPATPMGGKGYAGTVGDWAPVCGAEESDARAFFEKNFTPYQLSAGGERHGLFTGYYEPLIRASRSRHDGYQTPVYGVPPDLVRVDLSLFNPRFNGEHVSGRLEGHRLVPFATRADINAQGMANTPILFWTDDAIAFFFLQIQGSGRVEFDNGEKGRIAYAGENGRPYTAIGRNLIREGALTRENVSLAAIRDWLKAHPDRAQEMMENNQSFIFFEERPVGDESLGATGTLGVALTPRASLAIDPRLNVLGAPYYVDAAPVTGLLIAQDTGGAIRGEVRGDIFFGFGEKAEKDAGGMKSSGDLYVLLPNAVAARLGAQRDFP